MRIGSARYYGRLSTSQQPTSVIFPRQPEIFDASEGVEDVSIGEVNERVLRLGNEDLLVTVGSLTVLLEPAGQDKASDRISNPLPKQVEQLCFEKSHMRDVRCFRK